MWAESVAADTAVLTIPLDTALVHMPGGAAFTARSGRASVTARVTTAGGQPAALVIESSCDSLERLCWRYEAEMERFRAANATLVRNAEESAIEHRSNSVRTTILQIMAGLVLGIVITLITKRIWQKVF